MPTEWRRWDRLTASIAHEIRQPIAATVTNAQAALRWLVAPTPDLEEVRQALVRIVDDGTRANDVIGRIRALVAKSPARRDRVAMNDAIHEVIALTRVEAAKHSVSVESELEGRCAARARRPRPVAAGDAQLDHQRGSKR